MTRVETRPSAILFAGGWGSAMFDRMSVLLGAGVITVGVSAALLAGAGAANAVTESAAGGDTSTSDSSPGNTPTAGTDAGSGAETDADSEDANAEPADPESGAEAAYAAETDADSDDASAELGDLADAEAGSADPDADQGGQPDPAADADLADRASQPANSLPEPEVATDELVTEAAEEAGLSAAPDAAEDVAEDAAEDAAEQPVTVAAGRSVTPEPTRSEPAAAAEPAPVTERLPVVSAAEPPTAVAAAPRQTLLSILGAAVFNLYSLAIRVVGGPPSLPRGSTVTVASSTLEIDCGDGYEVPADWYVPAGPTPTQLIYLQHGFLAAGPFYSYTAARLAEATHSVVVTTSLTSNFLACDGCWVGGSPMHRAVADLFVDGNSALADSAAAAGYGPALLDGVHRVVLTGHSAGGGLAIGAAGHMVENDTIDRLAGVVMFDGVGFGSVTPDALATVPDEVPVYNIAGMAYFWNINGSSGAALEEARPDQFTGVRLIGGLHSDAMTGGNPLIQAGLYAVTGFSLPVNVTATEMLSAAWINDMFSGTAPSDASPFYGPLGSTIDVDTPVGTARAYVQPGPAEQLSVFDVVFEFAVNLVFGLDFATCRGPETTIVMELLTPNTALSLDGGAKPRQAIGQQCMQG